MPRVKTAKSLSKICIDFILENKDSYNKISMSELEDEVLDVVDSEKSVMNPFDGLPSNLLEKLVELLRKKLICESVNRYEISPIFERLLTTSNLRSLDLTGTKKDEHSWILQSKILHLATVRSSHLETLRLDSFHCHSQENLNFISKFSKLQVLDISFSEAGNDCFKILGTQCQALRELHAKFSQVSDDGIRELCVTGSCKSICIMDLTGCKQCTIKAIQIALDNLPELKILRHEFLLDGLAEIAQNALDLKLQLPKYSLSTLHVLDKTVYKSGNLRQSLLLCPNVTHVFLSLKIEGLKDIDLLSLLLLEKLCVLVIRHYVRKRVNESSQFVNDKDLTFNGGIAPLLKKSGSFLKTLAIEGYFLDVDIMLVIETCPNLQTLCLLGDSYKSSNFEEERNRYKKDQPVLKELEFLHITSENFCVPPQNLLMLLSSPSLTYVHIRQCDTLTDEILHRVVNIHSFCNLESLIIWHCNLITKRGIEIFLEETNPLRTIDIVKCAKITLENLNDWKKKGVWIKKNWQLKFHVSD